MMSRKEFDERLRVIENIESLRREYKDRDIGIGNFELFKVIKGRKWFRKSDRRK